MKQGQASSSGLGSRKTEPRGQNYTPENVATIGILELRTSPMQGPKAIDGKAPPSTCTVHECGSQGKH